MADDPSQGVEQVRSAEVIGALCLATELGMGFPFEHGLQSTPIAARLADLVGLDAETTSQTDGVGGDDKQAESTDQRARDGLANSEREMDCHEPS